MSKELTQHYSSINSVSLYPFCPTGAVMPSPITKRKYEGFHKDSREHVYKLQVAANRDHLKAGGAIDRRTGQLKSNPHPYEPLEKE